MTKLLTFVFLGVGVGLLLLAAAYPWKHAQLLSQENAQLEANLNQLKEFEKTGESLLDNYKAIPSESFEKLKAFLPEAPADRPLLVSFEKIAELSGVTLRSVAFAEESSKTVRSGSGEKEAIRSLSFSLGVSAGYEAFISFLLALERHARLVDVTEISFGATDAGTYDFSLKGKSYYRK